MTMALAKSVRTSSNEIRTNDGTVNVAGLENDATWEYSLDSGKQWKPGSGTSLRVRGVNTPLLPTDDPTDSNSDGERFVRVRQTDKAGNHLLSVGVPAARIRQRIEPVPAARQSGTEALEIRIQKVE
ncbi:hypothetical protein [Herbaspirillum sp. C7C2]|uniref:hypothetical protein n=1 Tax=Herbaspirillum sp. C7C2 TaxID=2736666 RepID=UPI001F52ABB7|nr:hypothetical protein [Herbaspirillum sp. C7C2]